MGGVVGGASGGGAGRSTGLGGAPAPVENEKPLSAL
jgi:hypothetical protein